LISLVKNMDAETIKLLEFARVLEFIAGYAQTETGKSRVLKMTPGTDPDLIRKQLSEIGEMQEFTSSGGSFSCGHLPPVSDLIRELENSAQPLAAEDLHGILEYLKLAARAQRMFPSNKFPLLASRSMRLRFSQVLLSELERYLTPAGEIRESAVPELARARSELQRARSEVQKSLARHLKGDSARYLIPDPYITQRGDRFVIPVRSEFQSSIPGLVHGSSSSGATVFLEPLETVGLNNQIIWLSS